MLVEGGKSGRPSGSTMVVLVVVSSVGGKAVGGGRAGVS